MDEQPGGDRAADLTAPNEQQRPGERVKELFMVVEEPDVLISALKTAGRCVILHGHRHIRREDEIAGMSIYGAPSTTLGNANPGASIKDPGFYIYDLEATGPDDAVSIGNSYIRL